MNTSFGIGEQVIVSVAYMTIPIALSVFYVAALAAMIHAPAIYLHSSYKIMIVMGMFDLIQLVFLGPLCSIYSLYGTPVKYQSKLPGAITIASYYASNWLVIMLAIERCIKTWYLKTMWITLFGGKKIYVWISVSLVFYTALFVPAILPSYSILFDINIFTWNFNAPAGLILFDMFAMYGGAVIIIVSYSLIAIKLHKLKQLTNNEVNYKQERSLFYQCACIGGTMIWMTTVWFWAYWSESKWGLFCGELGWIFHAGMNGVIYLVFNSTIRNELKSMMRKTVLKYGQSTRVVPG